MNPITWIALGFAIGISGISFLPALLIILFFVPFLILGYLVGVFLVTKEFTA